MNDEEKIRLIKSSLNAIEEIQVRLIACLLFAILMGIAFCIGMLLYSYFIG